MQNTKSISEMAIQSTLTLPFIVIFTLLNSSPTIDSSSVASNQLKFWYENVQNKIPKTLLSKLSPLSSSETAYFASSPSSQPLFLNKNLCALAHLSCSATVLRSGCMVAWLPPPLALTDHIDLHAFFRLSVLKEGNTIHLLNLHDPYPHRSFLPYEIASKITVDSINLEQMFPQSLGKTTKDAIKTTLTSCTKSALKGEIKSCPTSLEDTIKFSKSTLGKKNVFALVSESLKGSQKEFKIGNIKQYEVESIVSCHEVYLPFVVYFCHMLPSTRLYNVDLVEPKTGAIMNTVLVGCHMDTSSWSENHPGLKMLGLKPGEGEACHGFSETDLVWIGGDEQSIKMKE